MTRRLFALGAVLLLTAAAPPDDHGRPVILLVHGRGMVDRDSAATRKLWLEALTSGLKTVTRDSLIAERDVRVVWYADVLDPRSNAGCDYDRGDVRAHHDATQDPDLKSFASLAGNLIGSLSSLVADTEMMAQLRGLASDAAFLSDARKRCASERRLADAIDRARREGRPVVLVAHSLGSLVAYDYLSSRTDSVLVNRFVTIGSMLGSPELRRLLIGGDSTDALSKPASAKEWINIFNEQDAIAGPVGLGHDVPANPPADEPDPHEMVGYLRGSITAKEVLNGWCAAFQSTSRPPGCRELVPK
jgi:pimeloyl-ACP methyl ester carboxylesterase